MSNRIFDTVDVNCLQLHLSFSWQRKLRKCRLQLAHAKGAWCRNGDALATCPVRPSVGQPILLGWEPTCPCHHILGSRVGSEATVSLSDKGSRAQLCLHSGVWGQPLSILSRLRPGPCSAAVANMSPPSPLLLSPRPHARIAFLFVIFHVFFLREIAQATDSYGKELMS